jgi:alpha-galactosidase/6-phospho-beta-glucosidase family protein
MLLTKITIIGAGSASFRLNTATALLSSERLRGSHLTRWTAIPKR